MPIIPPSSDDNANRIKGVAVDDTNKSDAKYLAYNATSKNIEYVTPPGATGGEANTASNRPGTAGAVGVFKSKSGVDLQFKKINAGSSKVTITDDTANDEVDIDVATVNLVNDAGSTTSDIFSASKVNTLLAGKSSTGHTHSPAEVIGLNEAVDDEVAALIQDTASIVHTYNDVANTMFLDVQANTSNQKVNIAKAGTSVGTRKSVNLIEGTGVTMTVADNSGSDRVDVTINASGGGGGGAAVLDDLTDVTLSSPSNGQVLKYNGSIWINDTDATSGGGGGGDASTNTALSVDGEVALFSGTAGKTIKRATGTGLALLTAGVSPRSQHHPARW